MQEADRKLLSAGVVAVVVVALELAWLLAVGPAIHCAATDVRGSNLLDWITSAAFWTAIFTFTLTVSTAFLWWTTQRTLRHAEVESSFVRRPKLRVRNFTVSTLNPGPGGLVIHFEVANVGNGTAMLSAYNCVFAALHPRDDWPLEPMRAHHETERRNATRLAPGASGELFQEGPAFTEEIINRIGAGQVTFTVYGYVRYIDSNKIERKTSFARRYESDTKRFRRSSEPDYEYED